MRKKPPQKKVYPPLAGIPGWKLWLFRLISAVCLPAVLFVLLEAALRIGGVGYPTSFLQAASQNGQKTFVQNNQFGWRFFGRQMAREAFPFSISQVKPPNTVRIFVFGESAAYGDPQPRFGLPRMIQAILSLRYPGTRFEVVNTGMTGINSHTILPIARDCAGAEGDIWVLYMGNNEVVGPFGAGTVFGPKEPALPFVRGVLAIKSTRTGQLLDALRQRMQRSPLENSEWGGMMMFLGSQVTAEDPRMNAVYDHFRKNLADILQAGHRAGAGIVLSTVAVNLKDCAPFASAHRPGLSAAETNRWEQLYQAGVAIQNTGDFRGAAAQFRAVAQLDDGFAELRFRQAQCALSLGEIPEARQQFNAARERDTLRFRCDGRLNELTRGAARGREADRILLADAERAFAAQSPNELPGDDFFYDHVHLTFAGNYLLARTIAAQIEKLLLAQMATRSAEANAWPSAADCARRLAWTAWDEQAALQDMLARLTDPPFTAQLTHATQIRRLQERTEALIPAIQPLAQQAARKWCEEAVAASPDDPWLNSQLATFQQMTGDLSAAAQSAQRHVQLLPSDAEGWSQLGFILVQQKRFEDAAAAFRHAFEVDSQNVWALQNLAQALMKLGRRDEAISDYRRALAIKPRFGLAWLGLGQALEEMGNKTEAEEDYHKALANRIHRAPELATLARFCQSRGWHEAAVTNYTDAIAMNPSDAMLHIEDGQSLTALGRHPEALRQYAEAVRLAPDLESAHFLLGLELGQANRSAEAVEQFREAVRIMPELLEARLNLGIALVHDGQNTAAMEQFQQVLKRSPANALALKYVQALEGKP